MPFFLASLLSCSEANELIEEMMSYRISEETRSEFIQVVKSSTSECNWDAKAD